ncbi:hypothetical protein [Streptomyces achromogenes]|uniref:hypothetical protein n=1 Tax=Streptomyces achromogenes TaxID=67255 RepID=UPI0004C48AE8|nr:hypothetical protein [Streptomyces achromogenes]
MYAFEPASPTYAISDTLVEHQLHGRSRTRADLPGGYRLTLRTREWPGRLEAVLFAPLPTGPARICTARISAHTPPAVTSRILDTVTRYAPALPDARDAHPPLQAVTRLLITGAPFQRLDEPGLFVRFGQAEAWVEGRRISVTLGSTGSGLSLVLGGPWDAPSTARLTAAVLHELTEAGQLAGEVAVLLEPGPWQVLSDQWHPDAALVLPATRCPDPEDPFGRRIARALREVQHHLRAARPDWGFQELFAVEGSAVALRVAVRDRAVPRLVRTVVSDGAYGPDELGNSRTSFAPAGHPALAHCGPGPIPRSCVPVSPRRPEEPALLVRREAGPRRLGVRLGWPSRRLRARLVSLPRVREAPGDGPHRPAQRPRRAHRSHNARPGADLYESVQLSPVDHRVEARLRLYAGRENACTLVRTVTLVIDLRAKRVMLPAQLSAALRHQAEVKGRRILDLLLAARRERRRGMSEPWAVLGPWQRGAPPSADT